MTTADPFITPRDRAQPLAVVEEPGESTESTAAGFQRARTGWTRWHLLAAVLLAGFAGWACADAWGDLLFLATNDPEASHVLLVPLIAAWLVYVRRGRLAGVRARGFWVGPAVVLGGAAVYFVGDWQFIQMAWHLGAVVVVVGAALTALGRDAMVKFLPAVLALGFMVPISARLRQAVALPLQRVTATVTQEVLGAFDKGAARSGNLLSINGHDVTVAEACSGMRSTAALVLVSYAFAFATPLRPWVRGLVIALSPVLAVTCNVIRLVPTVWGYGHLDAATADAVHSAGGWVMLFVGYFLLIGIVRGLELLGVPVAPKRTEL